MQGTHWAEFISQYLIDPRAPSAHHGPLVVNKAFLCSSDEVATARGAALW